MREPLLGIPHTEECRRKHERRMAVQGAPGSEKGAFDKLLREEEEVTYRKRLTRQAAEQIEKKNRITMEERRG